MDIDFTTNNLSIIAAIANNNAIGFGGDLLIRISPDLKRFKEITTNNIVIMGRKTYESLPSPLADRTNIVLSSSMPEAKAYDNVVVCRDLSGVKTCLDANAGKKAFIIGGGEIYNLFLNHCEYAYITKISADFQADTFFPDLDKLPSWEIKEKSQIMEHNGTEFQYFVYVKKAM